MKHTEDSIEALNANTLNEILGEKKSSQTVADVKNALEVLGVTIPEAAEGVLDLKLTLKEKTEEVI